jgi:hypothetical protein
MSQDKNDPAMTNHGEHALPFPHKDMPVWCKNTHCAHPSPHPLTHRPHCCRLPQDPRLLLGQAIQLRSALCLLRARAHEALDNRPAAIHWFRATVAADPYCQEALGALLHHHMLTNGEELALVDSLRLAPGDEWLQLLYRCQCKKVSCCRQLAMQGGLGDVPLPAQGGRTHQLTHGYQKSNGLCAGCRILLDPAATARLPP